MSFLRKQRRNLKKEQRRIEKKIKREETFVNDFFNDSLSLFQDDDKFDDKFNSYEEDLYEKHIQRIIDNVESWDINKIAFIGEIVDSKLPLDSDKVKQLAIELGVENTQNLEEDMRAFEIYIHH